MAVAIAERAIVEPDFFKSADALWEQVKSAMASAEVSGSGPLEQVASEGAYNFFLATADRILSHELVLTFLSGLRDWGEKNLGTRHASTPQIHFYFEKCRRSLSADATQAHWHYLYSLAQNGSPHIRLLAEDGPQKNGLRFARVANFQLGFNQLLVHETQRAYAVDGPKRANEPLAGAILLHGYLW